MIKSKRGQSSLEYVIVITLIIVALLAMKDYIKRGIQGRLRSATDDLGDQYDPLYANSIVNHTINSVTDTQIRTVTVNGTGTWTTRIDRTNSAETKTGDTTIYAY